MSDDLHLLIRRSIIDRGLTSFAARQEIYQQARTAVIRELWSYDPPLTEDEIDARVGQFDVAIDALEDDLAEVFAEDEAEDEPRSTGRQTLPARRTAAVFEGYDRETDYVPAYVAAERPPLGTRVRSGGGRDAVVAGRKRSAEPLDTIALRSAAIEAALRAGDGDGLAPEDDQPADPPESEGAGFDDSEPTEAADGNPSASWSWEDDQPGPRGDYRSHADNDVGEPEAQFADEGEQTETRAAGKRPWTALLGDLDERIRIRILVGAIAALGVVLLVLAGFMLSSLFASSPRLPETAASAGLIAETGAGGPGAPPAAETPADTVQSFPVFDGSDPTIFDSGPGNPVRFDKSGGFARISSSTSDPGVRVVVGPGLANRLSGRSVRVTLVARSARENGAAGLRFAYENGLAISPWQTANLGDQFQTYNLVWRVPAMRADPNADQLLIEPGIPGDGTAADIQSIKIDLLTE